MDKKVIEYKMISETDVEEFMKLINDSLKVDWSLWGDPFARAVNTGAARYS